MKKNFRFSLRVKFTAVIMLVVVFTATALTSFFLYTQKTNLRKTLEKRTEDIARRIANLNDVNIESETKELLQRSTDNTIIEEDVIYVTIYNRNVIELANSGITNVEVRDFLFHNRPETTDTLLFNKKEISKNAYRIKNLGEIYEVLVPVVSYNRPNYNISASVPGVSFANDNIRDSDTGEIIGIVRVGVTVENVNAAIEKMSSMIVLITLIVIILVVAISFLIVKVILNPIKELSVGTKKIASGELAYRVPLTSRDELSDLAESFNSMAQDLKSYVDELTNEKQDLIKLKVMLEQRSYELEETLDKMQSMQEELLKSEKFATIGRLASSVAHELRNPLASLKNISYYLSKMDTFKDDKAKKMLDMLASDVSRANKIITDLLDYSRAKKLNKIEMWIDDFLDKAIENVVIPNNIELVKNFEHFQAEIDPDKMTQVIINLITNAKDAMTAGGQISVSTAQNNSKTFEIRIADNGIGMSKDTLNHIFDPLYTTKLKGIGLGLSIVKEIIESHFGRIVVKSTEGTGTEFIIVIPMR